MKVACFDLETGNLRANFGCILCAGIKPEGRKPYVLRVDDAMFYAKASNDDEGLIKRLAIELAKYDVLVGHNIVRFDLRYLRARQAFWGYPPLPPMLTIDTLRLAQRYQLSSRKLDLLGDFVGIKLRKLHLDPRVWYEAQFWKEGEAQRAALEMVVRHCLADICLQEQLFEKMTPLIRSINMA